MGGSGGLQEATYAVPADKCGLVIGKGEENVSRFSRLCPRHTTEPFYFVSLIWLLFK